MKHCNPGDLDRQLDDSLRQLGLGDAVSERDELLAYLNALLEANTRINLTRITKPTDAVRLHVVDSLAALRELGSAPKGQVVDLGSGGGFPGVPLAISSGRHFVLLDSVAKKGAAVKEILDGLSGVHADIETKSMRAEDLAGTNPAAFAAVVARAVAPLPSLVELAAPLLMDEGLLIALKGRPESAELESGATVARLVGMEEISRREFALPFGGEERTIVVYRRVGSPKVSLPRRTGLAQHSPLA